MIDIIIPAYNAHKTIQKTLLSIEMQTIKDLVKVYIIDDASDKNYNYLKEIFNETLNLSIIRNKKNIGPGLSRQKAIEKSNGKYIVFLDSDDLFYDIYSLENLYYNIKNSDMVFGTIVEEEEKGKFIYKEEHQGCLHGKMYKRSIIEKYSINFCNVRNHEDNVFNLLYLNCCKKIAKIDKIIYIYTYNKESITHKNTNPENNVHNFIIAYTWLIRKCIKNKINVFNIACLIYYSLAYVYFNYAYYEQENLSFVYEELETIKKLYKKYNILSVSEKYYIYSDFIYEVVPKISIEKFIDTIK